MSEEFFFGCPVLQRFIHTTEGLIVWDLYDRGPWDTLKGQVESERPSPERVRKRAILCVGFSYEEIAFTLKKLKHHDQATLLRAVPGPIRAAADLDKLIEAMDLACEDVVANLVNDRMVNDSLGATQVATNLRESVRDATLIASSSVRFLRRNWDDVGELSACGMEFARVLETLHVAYERRFNYLTTIFGEATNGG